MCRCKVSVFFSYRIIIGFLFNDLKVKKMKMLVYSLLLPLFLFLSIKSEAQEKNINYYMDKQIICHKLSMEADGIVRLSKIEVYPEFLDEYIKYAVEVGEISLLTEPGVLTMYAVSEKDNPCKVTILETYASKAAYEQHIASEHFQKYKQGTLHMVKSLLLSDQIPLNPNSHIDNVIRRLY